MRILFVTPFVPAVAAGNGGSTYLANLAQAMARTAELGMVALRGPETADLPLHHLATADATGRSPTSRLRTLWRWRCDPLVVAKAWHPAMPELLRTAVAHFRPDVALVEMAQMAQYLPSLRSLPTVLTDHEAGCAANTRTGLGGLGDARDRRLWQTYVQRTYPLASALQAVTQADAEQLARRTGRPVAARPPTVPIPTRPVEPALAPPRALFLGDYRHGPNPEAAQRLARDVWPHVLREIPAAELWLAGPNDGAIAPLATVPGVRVLGFAPDLAALLAQVRVLLAPLWSGDGFRVKVMTALAHGLPVVTNELGARGCSAPAPAVERAETGTELAQATARMLREPQLAAEGGRMGRAWAIQQLSAEAAAEWQLARIGELLAPARA